MKIMKAKPSIFFIQFLLLSFFLFGCEKQHTFNPTEHFYINDYADVLEDATIVNIALEGDRLFTSIDDIMHPGSILIVNTILDDGEIDLDVNDVETLMNRWSIDNKGMGAFINFYFRYQRDTFRALSI